jgi:hypothetical protein
MRNKKEIAPPIWQGMDLPKLREMPAYDLGRRGIQRPNWRLDMIARAAWELGNSEARITKNFNRIMFGNRRS